MYYRCMDNCDDTMRDEYDFSVGVRGKHARAAASGTNLVLLDPDVAELFPDSSSVNEVLRLLAKLAQCQTARAANLHNLTTE
jgi:hypothetical protein